jgi:two-component system sensor histidine kinase/response regulator
MPTIKTYKYYFLFFLLWFSCNLFAQSEIFDKNGKRLSIDDFLALSAKKQQEGDYKEASRFMNEAATWHWEKKEYEKAISYFEKSIKLNEVIDNQQGIIGIKNNLGMIYADLQQYEKAYQNFSLVLEERKKGKEPVSVIASLINIAVITNNLQQYNKSVNHLQEALTLALRMKDLEQMRSCYGMLAETYEKKGDVDNMLKYFNLYRTFHEEAQRNKIEKVQNTVEEMQLKARLLELENRNKALTLIQKDAVIDEQEKELAGLTLAQKSLLQKMSKKDMLLKIADNELKMKELQLKQEQANEELEDIKEQQIINILLISLAATALVIAILYKRNADKRQSNKILTEQKRQLEKQAEVLLIQTEELNSQAEELRTQAEAIFIKNEKLNSLNAVKDKMLSIIAHDVRSPLSMIIGFLDLLEGNDLNKEEQELLVTQLKSSTMHTLDMLEDLLNWARSQMGGIRVNPTKFNMLKLAVEKANFYGEMAQKKDIQIINAIEKDCFVYADQNHIAIVLQNLLSNAIKFTPKNGFITISLTETNIETGFVTIQVSDTGVGMEAEKLQKLFNTDSHFSTKGTEDEKGTGLGLLLCKEFVENNGGKITVASQKGEGTTFSFTVKKAVE